MPLHQKRAFDDPIETVVNAIAADQLPDIEPDDRLLLAWMEGLLTAAAIGPVRTRPDEWLQMLPTDLSGADPRLAETMLMVLGLRYNQVLVRLKSKQSDYVPEFLDACEDGEEIELAKEFAAGFHSGMHLRPGAWAALRDDTSAMESFTPIGVFLLRDDEGGSSTEKRLEAQDSLVPYIGDAVWELSRFWRRRAGRDMVAIRPSAKIGRNAHCTCGSGKKFKHCCMN